LPTCHRALVYCLQRGIDDEKYGLVFRTAIRAIFDYWQPGAVVLQCGADSLAGDRLGSAGHFNVSMKVRCAS
jgi:histone deacetylase 1/2